METSETLISVVIPVFNEALTIGNVIERLAVVMHKNGFNYEVIVIDDCSTDNSLKVSKSYDARVFSLENHVGKGYTLRMGFAKAKGEIVTTIDSDGSHRPEELPKLLTPIIQNKADLVIGSRYSGQKPVAAKKLNAAGVRLFNFLIKILTRAAFSDSQSGYRVMKASLLKDLNLKSDGYEIESEMLVKTLRKGLRVREVPISFKQRTYGKSRLDPAADGVRILLSITLSWIRSG